jgi:hypothetical protein
MHPIFLGRKQNYNYIFYKINKTYEENVAIINQS